MMGATVSVTVAACVRISPDKERNATVATKAEIIDAIQAGINRVESTFGQLPESQLDTRIHEEPDGWTVRQILAHLAGRQETCEMLIQIARDGSGTPPGGFNIDSWNARLVAEREGKSRNELLREFRSAHETLIERVEALRDDHLSLPVVFPNRDTNLGDVLLGSGGMHSIQHASEVEDALGIRQE